MDSNNLFFILSQSHSIENALRTLIIFILAKYASDIVMYIVDFITLFKISSSKNKKASKDIVSSLKEYKESLYLLSPKEYKAIVFYISTTFPFIRSRCSTCGDGHFWSNTENIITIDDELSTKGLR